MRIIDKKEMILEMIRYYSNGNKAQFAALIGITPQGLSTWIKRESFDIELVFAKCEGISAEWLLTGEGPMLKSPAENTHNNSDSVKFPADTNNTSRDPAVADSPPVGVPAYIQPLLDRIAQQAELIGRLRAQIEQLSAKVDELSLRDGNVTDVHSGSGLNCG